MGAGAAAPRVSPHRAGDTRPWWGARHKAGVLPVAPGRRLRAGRGNSREQAQPRPAGEEGQEAGINPRKGRLAPAGLGCSGWSWERERRRREGNAQGLSQASALLHLCRRPRLTSAARLSTILRNQGAGVFAQPQGRGCVSQCGYVYLQWEGRTWMDPAQKQPQFGGPIHWGDPILNRGIPMCRGAVLPALGCWLSPVPIPTAAHSSPAAPRRPGVAMPCVVPAGRGAAGEL